MRLIRRGAGASVYLTSLACAAAFVISAATGPTLAQGAWKQLFNGKDFTGWTIAAGGGRAGAPAPATPPSMNPEDRGWKVESGTITSAPIANGGRGGSLSTVDKFKDFELELDYKLDEAPNTECTAKLGEKMNARSGQMAKEQNLSRDTACLFNSGVYFRTGYQLNLGRREAGEYVGVVVHRQLPEAIRGNVDWLSTGDCGAKNHQYLQDCSQFPEIRKKNDWNHLRISFKGDHLQIWMNDKQITDVHDTPMAGEEWNDPAPIWFQPVGEGGGFAGKVQFRNIRVRTL